MTTQKRKSKRGSRLLFMLAALSLAAGVCVLAVVTGWHMTATAPNPSFDDDLATGSQQQDGEFPAVSWKRWEGVNDDVIGWISIPGTNVDSPIVQAHADEPEFYLHHDVKGEYNPYGCPYLGADCAAGGLLGSKNAVVFGHHMQGDAVFGQLARFSDAGFAKEHSEVLLQTKNKKVKAKVFAVDVVNADTAICVTQFGSEEEYRIWIEKIKDKADVLLDPNAQPANVVTLCTCSYNRWKNERTLVYCAV